MLHHSGHGILSIHASADSSPQVEIYSSGISVRLGSNKDQQNRRKHQIAFRQAATIFRDPHQRSMYDDEHSEDEDRWITIGLDSSGVLRVVIHTFEQQSLERVAIRIISARSATDAEAQQYVEEHQ